MHIVIFTHPKFMKALSIEKYTAMLVEHLSERNMVEVWTAKSVFYRVPFTAKIRKWMGYIDQFILFPVWVKFQIRKFPVNTLFVFVDQALGPWIKLVNHRPHVIHCHDFLALRSSLNQFETNKTGFSGKIYQNLILNGVQSGKNFISVSKKTRNDLHNFLGFKPFISRVVYNGLNQDFKPGNTIKARKELGAKLKLDLGRGYILHVGGNQFYKNRSGALKIYLKWREIYSENLPLLLVGPKPTTELNRIKKRSLFSEDIVLCTEISDSDLQTAYHGASSLIFPSLEEGFGWPIAEAMASGCPVITTDKAPMNEVGGNSCRYFPHAYKSDEEWTSRCAHVLNEVLKLSSEKRRHLVENGLINTKRFDTKNSLNSIEEIYQEVLINYLKNNN